MGRIFALLAAGFVALGAFFASRTASTTQPVKPAAPDTPPSGGARGIRNKNPMNLEFRTSIQWVGQLGTDGRFAVFDTALNGIRAGMINIHTKMTRDGLTSVRRIITRLSPAFENPTENFIVFVAREMGVSPDQPLVFTQHIVPMSKAIIRFETGEDPYPDSLLRQALSITGRG